MARELSERTAAILDSASTWHGVTRVWSGDRAGSTLRVGGRAVGRVEAETVRAHLPGKLPRAAVRHGLADDEMGDGWVRLTDPTVRDALSLLRLAHLSHVARARRQRPDAFEGIDVDAGLSELDLLPGVVHLVREQARA